MNLTRISILSIAAFAAIAAALLMRGVLGGGTAPVQASLPAPTSTIDVLVSARELDPGYSLDAAAVRWEAWPKTSVSAGFITKENYPDISKAVEGIVVRAPLVASEPVTEAKIVRSGASGYLAATIKPGKRAVSIPISAETGAGGFILPNDRVDVILSRDITTGSVKLFQTETLLRDVRVLAIDQAATQEKDQKSVVGKTATLELTQSEAEVVAEGIIKARAQQGALSLTLRALGDNGMDAVTEIKAKAPVYRPAGTRPTSVSVIRYGQARQAATVEDAAGSPQ
jgi:pilus assembly protein CpaB